MKCGAKLIALFTGNQFGKTAYGARHYVTRFMSHHPIADKNVDYLRCKRHDDHKESLLFADTLKGICPVCESGLEIFVDPIRKFRFCSENLPFQNTADSGGGSNAVEVRNTQYPELMKWMPGYLVKKNITQRNPVMVIRDIHGFGDIIVEFVSYNQKTQAMAGVQLKSVWPDEEPPPDFLEEQFPRLLASDGDMVITLTPANRLSYLYDKVYELARVYHRSDTIVREIGLPKLEIMASSKSIAVFQAATDDNPTLKPDAIRRIFEDIDDPDVVMIRRFGIFKQVSGRVYKAFSHNVHVIEERKYFPDMVPKEWLHARMIDWHDANPWAFMWLCMSPDDEAFVVRDANLSPDKFITYDIAGMISEISGSYRFRLDRIDPLATKKQPNTGRSSVDDLNEYFRQFKKMGKGTGAMWEGWDTKSERGREAVRTRLNNSVICGRPFNNKIREGINERVLPTLWILDCCTHTIKSLRNWRREEWADAGAHTTKDARETLQQKWSHFCMCLEAAFKENAFRARSITVENFADRRHQPRYLSRGVGL